MATNNAPPLTSFSPAYSAAFGQVARRMHFEEQPTPAEALRQWHAVVEGLRGRELVRLDELDEELEPIREPLSSLVLADELVPFPEHAQFVAEVDALDAAFVALTVPWPEGAPPCTDFRWWVGRVPRYLLEKRLIE